MRETDMKLTNDSKYGHPQCANPRRLEVEAVSRKIFVFLQFFDPEIRRVVR